MFHATPYYIFEEISFAVDKKFCVNDCFRMFSIWSQQNHALHESNPSLYFILEVLIIKIYVQISYIFTMFPVKTTFLINKEF